VSPLRPVRGDHRAVIESVRAWLAEADPEPLVVETSGSTGEPKGVELSRPAVVASATATHARLGGAGSWLLALPATYVAGLQVVVRSLLAGAEPVVVDEHDSWSAAVDAAGPGRRYASLVPTQLARLLSDADATRALSRLDALLLGGGPIDRGLRRRAEDAGVRVVATYGGSETAGGCVYDGVPLDGVDVDLEADGRIRLSGPMLFDGYEGEPERTAEVLVDGWFRTSDLGRLTEGRLEVLGRIDDVVLSGGVNVPTPAVARRLREHLGVEAVEVLGVPDETWGERVVAFLVGDLSLDDARDWVSVVHPREWAPRQVVTLDALPLLANGKVDRTRLRELA